MVVTVKELFYECLVVSETYRILEEYHYISGPHLWSSSQSSWLQIQRSRVRFSALPDFLRSGGSGTGSTQPREDSCGVTSRD
jgi:hypothetical protein